MSEISDYLSGNTGYLIAIGVVAIGILVLFFRRSNERYRKALEARRGYNCLSASMAWKENDKSADD